VCDPWFAFASDEEIRARASELIKDERKDDVRVFTALVVKRLREAGIEVEE
jgi:hypothetical protein